MNEEWKKIYSKSGKLMYEGFTRDGMPFGSGTSYYPNGNKCQEGIFDVKGLVYGKEYYRNGNVRFEGAYMANKGYGPNYPVFGSCCDEDGNEYFYGELTVKKSGLGYPSITKPAKFGPIVHKRMPDLKTLSWREKTSDKLPEGGEICYVKLRGNAARLKFIKFLEKNGFKCKEDGPEGRENTVGSRFPISIDVERKLYGHVGSTLCAAAAASSSVLISAEDFIAVFEVMSSIVIV